MATNRLQSTGEYQNAINYLYQRINYEKIGHANYTTANYRLARMQRLLQLAGNPQSNYPIVHVAGTKGKGSTATFIAELLRNGGLTTGLYTSPHLLKLEERIRVDGMCCSASELVDLVDRMRSAAEQLEGEGAGRATFFELTTAMGMLYFALQKVDVAVLEVGMGGRLDSTNVCQPALSVITSIGLDHQAQLGNTIREIAGEKAGIIKPGVPVVCTARHPDARSVITEQASELNSPLRLISKDFDVQWQAINSDTSRSSGDSIDSTVAQIQFQPRYEASQLKTSTWDLSILGRHQADNAAAALATVDWLLALGWQVSKKTLHSAIASTRVPARMEIMNRDPMQIIDAAHNPDSIHAMLSTLDEHFPGRRKIIVFASSKDKDYRQMLGELVHRAHLLVLTQYHNNPRSLPLADLVSAFESTGAAASQAGQDASNQVPLAGSKPVARTCAFPDPVRAWRAALANASPGDVLCATGSFFLAAELLNSPELFRSEPQLKVGLLCQQ